ncbi:MAG: hypothetical protein RML36_03190 [Anaerolineae bacterium]|nr:hypothetical protein [Anaerolineae bacterium]MDW8098473.1 hypothetical protein [Anaerolineae bacterium]
MKVTLLIMMVLAVSLSIGFVTTAHTQGATGAWVQVNISGFSDRLNTSASALAPFRGALWAGTYVWTGQIPAQLWRSYDGLTWTAVMTNGFGNSNNRGINHLFEFNGTLYASTINRPNGGEVWRSSDGQTFSRVVSGGFGDPTNAEVFRFIAFDNMIYASTTSYTTTHGAEIWRSSSGDSGSWTRVAANGFGDARNISVISFEAFNGYLYGGTWNGATGGEVWRTADGITWAQINPDGFGDSHSFVVSSLRAFNGYLYASVGHWATRWDFNSVDGIEIWRCQICDGSDWSRVVDRSFWPARTGEQSSLRVFGGHLYLVVGNAATGMQVWRTTDGNVWEQVGFAGFGDHKNIRSRWDNAVTIFQDRLFVGTENTVDGGEIWLYLPHVIFLPVISR